MNPELFDASVITTETMPPLRRCMAAYGAILCRRLESRSHAVHHGPAAFPWLRWIDATAHLSVRFEEARDA